MKSSPFALPCPFWSKYLPQQPILEQPPSMYLPQCETLRLTPKHNNRQNYSFVYLNLKSLDSKLEDKRFCTE